MPLNRQNITAASRVMLPTYVLADLAFGLMFVTDPENRLGLAPSLEPARSWLSLTAWGAMWLALSGLMLLALLVHTRWLFIAALALNVAAWLCWSLVVWSAVAEQPNVTYLSGALPLFVAVASYASLRSLLTQET